MAVGTSGAWRSSDWGKTWNRVGELPAGLSEVAVAPDTGSIWVAGMDDAEQDEPLLRRSDDGGVSWREDSGGHYITSVATAEGWVYASGAGELLRRKAGRRWQKSSGFPIRGGILTTSDGSLWLIGGDPARTVDHGQTWRFSNTKTRVRLYDLARSPEGDVYAVGEGGSIVVSRDDGQSWQQRAGGFGGQHHALIATPTHVVATGHDVLLIDRSDGSRQRVPWVSNVLTSVWAAGDRWFAAGYSGVMLSSSDQGLTWSELPNLMTSTLHRGVAFENGDVYVAGRGGVNVLRDHGQRRVFALQDRRARLKSAWGATPDDVWAVGYEGVVWRTTDRGATWQTVPLDTTADLSAIWGRGKEVMIVARWGTFHHSSDGGKTFRVSKLVKPRGDGTRTLFDVKDLWAGARGPWFVTSRQGLFRSAGKRWIEVPGLPSDLTAVVGDGRHVWVAARDGTIYRGSAYGAGFRRRGRLPDAVHALHVSDGALVAAGAHGLLARSTDGGKTWNPRLVSNHDNARRTALSAFEAQGRLWMAASRGNLFSSGDGGRNWALHALPRAAEVVSSLWAGACGTDEHIYYAEDTAFVSRSSDGGRSFVAQPLGQDVSLRALVCEKERVLGVGRDGWFVRSNDAGGTYASIATGSQETLLALSARGDELWAVGSSGTILHSQDAGDTWQAQASGTDRNLHSIARTGSGGFVVVGEKGTVLTSADGRTWKPEAPVVAYDLWSVISAADGRVYAAGHGGVVLERVTPVQQRAR